MNDYQGTPPAGETTLTHEVRRMPRWKVGLFVASLAIGVVGLATHFVAAKNHPQVTKTVVVTKPNSAAGGVAPPGSSGFMGGGGPADTGTHTETVTTTAPAPDTLMESAGPVLGKYGFSFFVGLVLGFVTRTFMKIAAGVAVLIAAAAFALHYFHVVDIDMTAVQQQTASASSWVSAQASHLKDLIVSNLPSAGAAGAGFLFGMKRR